MWVLIDNKNTAFECHESTSVDLFSVQNQIIWLTREVTAVTGALKLTREVTAETGALKLTREVTTVTGALKLKLNRGT